MLILILLMMALAAADIYLIDAILKQQKLLHALLLRSNELEKKTKSIIAEE